MTEVTPSELAVRLGISGKTFRAWLRGENVAGHPIVAGHEHRSRYRFSHLEADQLAADYRLARGLARTPGEPYRPAPVTERQSMARETSGCIRVPDGASSSEGAEPILLADPPRPSLPDSFARGALEAAGFVGWSTWRQLRATSLCSVPCEPGVYLVYRTASTVPHFLTRSPSGRFKNEDPSVSAERLKAEWVPDAHVLNIGKAAVRRHERAVNGLRARLGEYARYGAGSPVAHRGGRLIWQLADSEDLLVAWHAVTWDETSREYEKRLLKWFSVLNDGRRPFANLTG
jgi:hypothetical protein